MFDRLYSKQNPLIEVLDNLAEDYGQKVTTKRIERLADKLMDMGITKENLQDACNKHLDNSNFYPKTSELIKLCQIGYKGPDLKGCAGCKGTGLIHANKIKCDCMFPDRCICIRVPYCFRCDCQRGRSYGAHPEWKRVTGFRQV